MGDKVVESTGIYPLLADQIPDRELEEGRYLLRFAHNEADLDAILRMRYEVFNLELGEGLDSSHATGRDSDEFDPVCHHLMVLERDSGEVVGSYRMQTSEMAAQHRGFYSDIEFDLSMLPPSVRANAFEIGRACVAKSHRSTHVLFLLWKGLALYVAAHRKRFLFGCSSLPGQDPHEGKALMDHLEKRGSLHPELRVLPRRQYRCYDDDFVGTPGLEVKVPTLFRTYLRHGAKVCGPPAIDRLFKTIDFLVLFDVNGMDPRLFQTFFD
jgi:putative hemolysin